MDFIIFKEYFKLSDIVTVTDLYIFLIATMSDFYFQFFDNKRVTVILGFNKNVIAVDTTVGSVRDHQKVDLPGKNWLIFFPHELFSSTILKHSIFIA